MLGGAAVLALGACSSGGPADFGDQVPEGAIQVNQDNLSFKPNSLTVPVGEEVYFTNSETAVHNVVVDGEDVSGQMRKGDVVVYVFESPGEYAINCDYHPQMKATITAE